MERKVIGANQKMNSDTEMSCFYYTAQNQSLNKMETVRICLTSLNSNRLLDEDSYLLLDAL